MTPSAMLSVKLASGAEQITFTDTGQVVDMTGLDQATFAGMLESFPVPPPPPPPYNPTSADMMPAALETLLTSQGFSSAAIAQAITHTLTDGLIPVEQSSDSGGVTVPDMPITDGKLTDQIRVLDVQDNIGVVDTDSFPNLNDIVYGVGKPAAATPSTSGCRPEQIRQAIT
jgi:hypothetical protein